MNEDVILIYQDKHNYNALCTMYFGSKAEAHQYLKDNMEDMCPAGERMEIIVVNGWEEVIEGHIDNT